MRNPGYTGQMYVDDIKAFEAEHGKVKYTDKCLEQLGIRNPPLFSNKAIVRMSKNDQKKFGYRADEDDKNNL